MIKGKYYSKEKNKKIRFNYLRTKKKNNVIFKLKNIKV